MAERREIDLFAFIFNSDGEEDELPTEPLDEDAPLVDLTVDSDEDGASNSAAVIQQKQPQSSRQPRRAQTGQLPEPGTDSEDEDKEKDDDESDEETSSSLRKRPVKRGAKSRGRNVHSFESITFSQLEEKDKEGAQRVLDLYRDERMNGSVRVCNICGE